MSAPGLVTKAVLAVVLSAGTAAISAGVAALQNDGRVDGLEWLGLIGVVLTGLAVWGIQNMPSGVRYWSKAIVTVIGGAITSLTTSLAGNEGRSLGELFGDMQTEQWLLLLLPILNGVVVALAPNAQVSDDPPQPGGDPTPRPAMNLPAT